MKEKNEIEKIPIILKWNNTNDEFEDITNKVNEISFGNDTFYIKFFNSDKVYSFSSKSIFLSDEHIPVPFENKEIFINNNKVFVSKILFYINFGFKIFLKDGQTLFVKKIISDNKSIRINTIRYNLQNLNNNVFDYYRELSYYAGVTSGLDDTIEKVTYNLYKSINSLNSESVLNSYTNQKYEKRTIELDKLIFPFSTNKKQMEAVYAALTNNLTVISGPPGTGKTQVILNIIVNCIIQNKKIAIISNNNSAVENVYDKFNDEGYEYLLANLGNLNNVANFFSKKDNLKERITKYEQFFKVDTLSYIKKLINVYKMKNDLQNLKNILYDIELEYKHFKQKNEEKIIPNYNLKLNDYRSVLKLKNIIIGKKRIGLISIIMFFIKYNINLRMLKKLDSLVLYLDNRYYDLKINEIKESIILIEDKLKKEKIEENELQLKENSKIIFRTYLYNKYINKKYPLFDKDNYKNMYDEFTDRYQVILSTTHSILRNCESNFLYDLIIIDEASQSDILTTLYTMNIAKNMVIIGDTKQLSQIDNQKIYNISEELAKKYNIQPEYKYKNNSILNSISSLKNPPIRVFLEEHYRCDARIIKFCNEKFYDKKLVICTNTSSDIPLEIIHTAPGNHARKNPNGSGIYNLREIDEILFLLENEKSKNIGIITPFRCQAKMIKNAISQKYPYVEADTIHKYQGRQKEIIILSTVVNDLSENNEDLLTNFVTNPNLLNVAISRAVKKIYLIVSENVYKSSNNNIAQFIDYIKYYCNNIKEGKVISIFDNLYKDSYDVLNSQNLKTIYDSPAEKLVVDLIKEILNDFPDYSYSLHIRLSDLIQNVDGFNIKEISYILHPKTHIDLVIYDKITFKPKLCIEVDGTKYHDYSKKQKLHDQIKTSVLLRNNINIIRLKTNESNEKERIREELYKNKF